MSDTTVAAIDTATPAAGPPAWVRALTLTERAAAGAPEAASEAGDLAHRRLQRWKRAHGLADGPAFAARLAALPDGCGSEASLLALLAEPPERLSARVGTVPDWSRTLDRVLSSERRGPTAPEADWRQGMAAIVEPFAEDALRRLEPDIPREHFDALRSDIAAALNVALLGLATRTLVLELNVLRVEGRLTGDTPEARFASFVAYFTAPEGRRALLTEYQVLGRLLSQRADQTVTAVRELLRRWAADREAVVAALFGAADPGPLTGLTLNDGDTHQGGRAVAILGFASGARLVYKPRSVIVHARFATLLRWFDERAGRMGLRVPEVVEREGYGWIAFVDAAPCHSLEEVDGYYRRLGALLALLHTIEAADFHFENLIAHGDQPVLIDLEALFHPQPARPVVLEEGEDPALTALNSSVTRVGVLPMLLSGEGGELDLGGLGGDAGAMYPFALPTLEDGGTDTMRMVRRRTALGGGSNKPTLDGVPAEPARHVDQLVLGFRTGYDVILRHREEFAAAGGPLTAFAEVEVRAVLRATHVYGTLLDEGSHPDLMRDALNRDRHLDFLWSASSAEDSLLRVVPYEQADLWAGDIPLFTGRPGSRDLWDSRGERIPGFFPASPLDRVHAKLAGMGAADRARQEWIIRATLATRPAVTGTASRAEPAYRLVPQETAERCLEQAVRIGDRLTELAIRDGERVSWLGLQPVGEAGWRVSPLKTDLYGGHTGIAVFLARLGAVTGERRFVDLARRAFWMIPPLLDRYPLMPAEQRGQLFGLGGFSGMPGLAYGLLHVASCAGADAVPSVVKAVEHVGGLLDEDVPDPLDILGGSAGTIGALLAVHAHTGSDRALDVAIACGRRLVDRAASQEHGVAWPAVGASRPLSGFSHGAAGVGWALIRLGAVTGQDRFTEAGLGAFAYERADYSPQLRNWPDHRVERSDGADTFVPHMYAWCHGAPGIGLARAGVLDLHDDPALRADLDLALAATVRGGLSLRGHSLCHGVFGNADLLLLAEERGARLAPQARSALLRAVDSLDRDGPVCGTPGEIETPSLMTGLAGIGYGLLRLASPETVPSVLLFEPPKRVTT
ncbi:type 2 lanthipeptide synthetase LanM family protein [Nonomuraea pusilla]|uniref:Type 2 lantibiotic biosynthesis protein LanM n=1 Tax=Nonomuraea pusilla TaxID=46177 RepID=A0A1H7JMB0_9ACTN|nr:type 2 lanthipeptide synthetase LanM family protein [Nonomuraea pusilla]SEK75090.1 type 2 lantibiotic biosynthesis protein LanM [Nonomuraea pusilla]